MLDIGWIFIGAVIIPIIWQGYQEYKEATKKSSFISFKID